MQHEPVKRRASSSRRFVRLFHKWLAIVIAAQMLLWMASGFFMSFSNIDAVHGDHLIASNEQPLNWPTGLLPPQDLAPQLRDRTVHTVEWVSWLGRPVYRVSGDGFKALYDATDGRPLSPIGQDAAAALVRAAYLGEGEIVAVEWLENDVPMEARGRAAPLWRVRIDDASETTVYVSANSGQVVAVRSGLWRWFDFFWMLHIMDYSERDDFNHPLLYISALLGLVTVLSGVTLFVQNSLNRRRRRSA